MFGQFLIGMFMLAVVLCLPTGCFHGQSSVERMLLQQHPLAGKIWDVAEGRFIDEPQLLKKLVDADYLLLGETHDNIEHHRRQAQILRALQHDEPDAAVYFEMIDDQQAGQLGDEHLQHIDRLIEELQQAQPGWDYENMYRVVFEAALQAGFPVRAANLSRDKVIDYMQREPADWPEDLRSMIQRAKLDEAHHLAMQKEAVEAHCNSLPDAMVEPMIRAQRLRDAKLAMSMVEGEGKPRVLITGSGHARRDRGVPHYLRALGVSDDAMVSLSFMEVQEDALQPGQYSQRWDDTLPFDVVWFTPRFDRDDPCEGLEIHMRKAPE